MGIKITLVLLLLVLATFAQVPLQIIFVSSSPNSIANPVLSSLRGGTFIYIKAMGHSPDPSQNAVYVGTFPCTIPADGVTDTFISCQTTDSGSLTNINSLPVTLISYGTSTTSSSPNVVTYSVSVTPYLVDVFPSAGLASSTVNFYGTHRITDLGDGQRNMGGVSKLLLGGDLCSRFDINQAAISANSNQYIQCLESSQQEAGKYNITELVTPGKANNSRYMRRSSLDPNEYFEFTALPSVSAVSPTNGNIGGQYLTITGKDFSANPKNNTVTVDGNDCAVTSATSSQIQCTLAPRNNTLTSLLSSNSTSQHNGYFSGSGAKYARYTLSTPINSISNFITAVRASNTVALGTPQQTGFRADLREADVYGSYYAQTWNGYFTAPRTGFYTFRGTSNDAFSFFLAQTYGSSELPTNPLIYSNSQQSMWNFWANDYDTAEQIVQLQQGMSYYFQAYHINYAGSGFFDLEVEVPNTDSTTSFQVYQVDKVTTNTTIQPEVVVYSMVGGSSGIIQLQIIRTNPTTFAITYDVAVNITYGCTDTDFQSALSHFDGFNPYVISVVRKIYDGSNNIITTLTGAAKVDYVVSFQLVRASSYQTQKFKVTYFGYTGTFTPLPTTLQTHSPLLTGTFTMSIGGVPILVSKSANIPYNATSNDLQTAIRGSGIVGFDFVEVVLAYQYGCGYSCTWILKYKGFNGQIPPIVLSAASLSGGVGSPSLSSITRRNYSSNIEFDPIDYRFLHTYSNSINVQVSTNGIPSLCTGACSYSFNTYTEITALSYNNAVLSLSLSDPTSLNFPVSSITISVGGKPCTVVGTSTLAALTCNMATNTDSSPILVAGAVTPLVYVTPYGIAGLKSTVNPLSIQIVANSLSVTSGGNNGGYLISLLGHGFPLQNSQISITICGSLATIKATNNIQVDFYVPACSTLGAFPVNIAIGSLTSTSLTFTYINGTLVAPTIISLSPTSANPGVKGTLQINGENFGTNISAVQVFLANATGKVYPLNIMSITNTSIKVGLSGGLAGRFTVQVNMPATTGDSLPYSASSNIFDYKFDIASVSPSTGSINGGTLLTITGNSFALSTQDTQVYIGTTLNWFCNIESITATQILCRTPPISSVYTAGVAVDVVAATRLVILNTCSGTCKFTYLDQLSSPNTTAISTQTVVSTTSTPAPVTLTGTNLIDSNNQASVSLTNTVTNVVTVVPSSSSSATSVAFNVPSTLVSGTYQVRVRNAIGESNPQKLTVNWNVGAPSWNSGGSNAGAIVSFTGGAGYGSSIDGVAFSVTISINQGVALPATIVSCCNNNVLKIALPAAPDQTAFGLTLTGPNNQATFTYTTSIYSTPTASITSAKTVSVGVNTIQITATNAVAATITAISLISTFDSSQVITVPSNSWTTTGTGNGAVTSFSATLLAGSYNVMVSTTPNGYVLIADKLNVQFPTNVNPTAQQVSFNGGFFTIAASDLSPVSTIAVNGFLGSIVSYSTSSVTYAVPALVTPSTQSTFALQQVAQVDNSLFTYFSDDTSAASHVGYSFDGLINTYYNSTNTVCWIGMDIGSSLQVSVNRISFFPNVNWPNVISAILYATFQGSNDMTTWHNISIVDQTVHSGWNVLSSSDSTPYRYIRFLHNATSHCNIAEIKLFGIVYSTLSATLTSQFADVIYNDGFNSKTFSNAVEYRQDHTPTVTLVSPRYGDVAGNYVLTLTGTYLNSGTATITIDGVNCPVTGTPTATTITCLVAARNTIPTVANTFTVKIGASKALLQDRFLYVLKWSSAATWGSDAPPIDNDLIYVPLGTTLLVDQNTPVLNGIAVEGGTLVFSDDLDLVVQAGFITMNGGSFIAGTEAHPHTHKLTFIMYGGYYDAQQPMFGNKGIGCMNCKFSMYGTPRISTWTTIASTINVGDTSFAVKDNIDWQIGEVIVVASTSFLHTEAERKTITGVSGKTVTVDSAFQYKHVSVIETYGSDLLVMAAEVGLLTRNIKMMGDPTSVMRSYGSHLMLTGKSADGFEAHVAFSEFTNCGQPQILGRYCIHFHMAGDVPTSYARGNAVHDSFARVITLHGVYHLTVEYNVGFRVHGHNFFVEDGIETHNVIRYNLAISSLSVTNMLQTDTSVASFWITNPTNDFYGNHAAGSDFYGIWYEIKSNPDGPSATMDVCPIGNTLGSVYNNTAHSNIRFGLRVFKLYSRLYPCRQIRNDSNADDPWSDNPSVQSIFYNFTVYKNLEDGVLAEQTGNLVFNNFIIAENYRSGIEFYLANFTKEPPMISNSAIIGMSVNNAAIDTSNYTNNMSGAITGRSGVTKISNTHFYNFPAGSLMFQTCRLCDDPLKYTNIGTEVIVSGLTFTNISGKMLFMIGLKRDIIYDLDGSLSSKFDGATRASGTIVYGYPHIATTNQATCLHPTSVSGWDNTVMCGPTVTLRRVLFGNIINHQLFQAQLLKVKELTSNINQTVSPTISSSLYTAVPSRFFVDMEPKVQTPFTWSLPYITGRMYNVWWGSGIDFSHLSIYTSPSFNSAEPGIIFKFNYTQNRELFRVGPMRGGAHKLTSMDYINVSSTYLDPAVCGNGQYYFDNEIGPLRMLEVCVSGKDRTKFEYTEVNGVVCELLCPLPAGTFIKENFVRKWSNATQWPNQVVPLAGDNVTVNGNWTVLLDVDPNPLNFLVIDGTLFADDSRNVNITANSIHIRAGNITAGSPGNPFLHNFTIQLNGKKTDNGFYIDPIISANKFLVVTGSLNLYGNTPGTVTTYLTQTALKGSSTIFVGSSTGWNVGDTLVLSPSNSIFSEFEKVTIQAINADGSLNLKTPLTYNHYGASSFTINNNYGKLDARTQVGHVNRNIQIVPGPDAGWGFTVYIYGFLDSTILRIGSAQLNGVQFQDGGQLDTLNSPLVFMNTVGGNYTSSVVDTSFVNCKANCLYVQNAQNLSITNNVLYNAWVFGAQFTQIKSVTFSSNLIIGVDQKPTLPQNSELVACVYVEQYVNPATDLVSMNNNFCLGSVLDGFALPFVKCNELQTNPFANNTVGSALIGFILNTNGEQCQGFSYAKAYACKIGQICGPPGISTIMFTQFIMADNQRGITLKLGASEGHNNHSAYLYNSYVTAISRPTCATCYGDTAISCNNNIGMRMLTASNNGQELPKKYGTGFDVVCKQPVFDSKSFLYNVTFDNFKQTYTSLPASCGKNFAFRPHASAWDMSGGVNLFTSKCTNCDVNSYLLADAPNPAFLGWFGGCGDLLCTGLQNYLISDFDGTFFAQKGTIIPNNSVIATNETGCTYSSPMNAYMCQRLDFAALQYQNVAADFNTRIMWPVTLKYDGGNYTTITNGWRDWQWLGNEPQNKRFGRFVSLVRLNQTFNMSYASEPPHKLQIQIQKQTPLGESNNYIVFRLYYPLPNSIRVTNLQGTIIDPILLTDFNNTTPGILTPLNKSSCGSHIYFYTNRTVQVVVTEAIDCVLTVELTESVQLTTHFAIDINTFFSSNSSITNFINNLCALLNIVDTSRVKVVGVFSGSTDIVTAITPSASPTDPTVQQVQSSLTGTIGSGAFASAFDPSLGTVLGASSVYYPLASSNPSSSSSSSSNAGMIAGIAVASVVLLVGVAFTSIYCLRKRGKVSEEIITHEDEIMQQKQTGDKEKSQFMFNDTHEVPNESEIKIKAMKVHSTILHVNEKENPMEIIDS